MPSFTTIGDGTRTVFQIPDPVTATSDVTSVLVNGSAGPSVSAAVNDLITLASAPASGATVAFTYKDRVVDTADLLNVAMVNRPVLVSYTGGGTHVLTGTAEPSHIVEVYLDGAWVADVVAAADGAFTYTFSTFTGTKRISAKQRKQGIDYKAFADGYGISSVY
jgi:hypothetical protein